MCSNAPDRLRHVPRHGSGKSLIAFKTQHPRMTRSETLVRCCECVLRHSQRSGPFSLSRSLESVQKGSECSLGISPCALAGLGYITRTNGTMFESSFSARERERERGRRHGGRRGKRNAGGHEQGAHGSLYAAGRSSFGIRCMVLACKLLRQAEERNLKSRQLACCPWHGSNQRHS